jgi:hypothetical protein
MTDALTWSDRLRIERAVWTLNACVANYLPRRSRAARRRELRLDLRAAAADVGRAEALRRLGDPRLLAAEYVTAEYGDRVRWPRAGTATVCMFLAVAVSDAAVDVGTSAFRAGILAASPHPAGTFRWPGIPYLSSYATVTFTHGHATTAGGAWTPLAYLAILAAGVIGGRLWRLPAAWHLWRAGRR